MKLFNADAIVRSKDAGPFRFTLDVIFNDRNQFEAILILKKCDILLKL